MQSQSLIPAPQLAECETCGLEGVMYVNVGEVDILFCLACGHYEIEPDEDSVEVEVVESPRSMLRMRAQVSSFMLMYAAWILEEPPLLGWLAKHEDRATAILCARRMWTAHLEPWRDIEFPAC